MHLVAPVVLRYREAQCAACPAPCVAWQRGELALSEPAAACPIARWPASRAATRRMVGLGDVVAALAQPVAKLVGKTDCAGCKKRKAKLNAAVPDVRRPFAQQPPQPPQPR